MDIKNLVTESLKKNGLESYPGRYWDVTKAKLIEIYHPIYFTLLGEKEATEGRQLTDAERTAIMQEIDVEVEARGYYLEKEEHNTPLIVFDPDLPRLPIQDKKWTDNEIAEIIKENVSLKEQLKYKEMTLNGCNFNANHFRNILTKIKVLVNAG